MEKLHISEPINLTIEELIPREELWARLDTLYNHLKDAQIKNNQNGCAQDTSYLYELRNEVVGEITLIKKFLYIPQGTFCQEDSPEQDGKEA